MPNPMADRHNSATCTLGPDGLPCDACRWANGVEASRRCVVHSERPAAYTAQGIVVCEACWQQYQEEYLRGVSSNNVQLLNRPFLQRLIRASVERSMA